MTATPLRKDAARNWQRIVDAGRQQVDAGRPVQLNEVARTASVGVATVYRHFPTPDALLEALAEPGLTALVEQGERALTRADTGAALSSFLLTALEAQVADPAVAHVFSAPRHTTAGTADAMRRLVDLFGALLDRARSAGAIDPQVTHTDLVPLVCGVAYAAGVRAAGGEADRSATVRRYLTVLMNGLRADAPPA